MTAIEPIEAISFAWTPGADAYKFYPPYLNLTGNRLAVRGLEKKDRNGNLEPGEYVVIELPEDAIAELRAALRSSAPQEPDDALEQIAAFLVEQRDEPWPDGTAEKRLHYWRDKAIEGAKRLRAVRAQEPVADDDAEFIRSLATETGALFHPEHRQHLERIAARLQAKAPDSHSEMLSNFIASQAPETGETP